QFQGQGLAPPWRSLVKQRDRVCDVLREFQAEICDAPHQLTAQLVDDGILERPRKELLSVALSELPRRHLLIGLARGQEHSKIPSECSLAACEDSQGQPALARQSRQELTPAVPAEQRAKPPVSEASFESLVELLREPFYVKGVEDRAPGPGALMM